MVDFELTNTRAQIKGDVTRERIKTCARELFTRFGLERVTIRDIAKYAGQRNGGSVNYYFRSKEELIAEILTDAAKETDALRGKLLDNLIASGEKPTIRTLLKVMVNVDENKEQAPARLFMALMNERRDLMHRMIPGHWDQHYLRCVAMLRPLLPPLPEVVIRQRIYLVLRFLWDLLATREESEDRAEFSRKFWSDPSTVETLFDAAEGILVPPISSDTEASLKAEGGGSLLPELNA